MLVQDPNLIVKKRRVVEIMTDDCFYSPDELFVLQTENNDVFLSVPRGVNFNFEFMKP